MAMTSGGRGPLPAEMNVTPMIDVLLVLIIIFMMMVPARKLGEMAELPQKTDNPEPQPRTVVIQVLDAKAQRPTLKINEEPVSWDKLEPRLAEIFRPRAERVAFLKGDPNVDFQYVADVLDMTHHAGVDRVGLMSAAD